MTKKSLLALLLMLAMFVVIAGCGGSDEDPVDGDTNPDGDSNVDGDTDGDTTDGDATDGDATGPAIGDGCETNADCPDGASCHNDTLICTEQECETDGECVTLLESAGAICDMDDYLCYLAPCDKNADCPTGTACLAGVCTEVLACPDGESLVINEGSGVIREGESLDLSATLLNTNGAKLELTAGDGAFTWATDDSSIVDVAADGTITGGGTAGTATITAKLTCDANSPVATVTYINFNNVTSGSSRVIVFDQTSGEMVTGARVILVDGTRAANEATTTDGVAEFANVDCSTGCDMHVFHDDYTFVSAFGLAISDFYVPLAKNTDKTKWAGVKGQQDASAIPEIMEGDVRLGISMFSIPGSLADLNFESLIGEMVPTHIAIGAVFDDTIDLPTGVELYLMGDPVVEGFKAQGMEGKATLWGLGGYADLQELITVVTQNLGDEINIGPILGALLPLFGNFYHGIEPGYDLVNVAKPADLNFDQFEDIGDFLLSQKQTKEATVKYPTLTSGIDSVISLIGAMQTGVGFVPLGLTAGLDAETPQDTADGKINDVTMPYAPQHSGLSSFPYYTISIGLNLAGLMEDTSSIDLAGAINRSVDAAPTSVTVPSFPGFMSDAAYSYENSAHSMTATPVSGASFHRVVLSMDSDTAGKFWHIYWGPTANGFSFDQPTGLEERTATLGDINLAQAIMLGDSITYEDLFEFNGTNLNMMNDFISSFSMHYLPNE